jgi:hypothetical protein
MRIIFQLIILSIVIVSIIACKKDKGNPDPLPATRDWKYIGGDEFNNNKKICPSHF